MTTDELKRVALWHLKCCPLFSEMSPKELGDVVRPGNVVSFSPDEPIPMESTDGEPALWVVKRGHVKQSFVDSEGRQATVLVLGPGDIFGSLFALGDDNVEDYGEHCRTMTSVCLCRISRQHFESLIAKYPNVAYRLTKSNFQRIHRLQARLADLLMRPAEARLALVLMELKGLVGVPDEEEGIALDLPLAHSDLAQLIGSSREMVTHLLGKFRRAGIVRTSRERIVLLDAEALKTIRDDWKG